MQLNLHHNQWFFNCDSKKIGPEDVCCIYITSRCTLPILPNKLKIEYGTKFHRSIEQLVPKIDEIDG